MNLALVSFFCACTKRRWCSEIVSYLRWTDVASVRAAPERCIRRLETIPSSSSGVTSRIASASLGGEPHTKDEALGWSAGGSESGERRERR